jgi:hypothetical protein
LLEGLIFFCLGLASFYARRYPWNADKSSKHLIQFAHWAITIAGVVLMVWAVDPRLLYGIYPILFVMFLKDGLTLLLIAVTMLYVQALQVILVESRMQEPPLWMKNPWIYVGVPMAVLAVIEISTAVISLQTNQEVYRAIFFGTVGVYIAAADFSSLAMYFLLDKAEKRVAETRTSSGNVHQRKQISKSTVKSNMAKCTLLLTIIVIMQIQGTVDVVMSKRTLIAAQIPDPSKYRFLFITVTYIIGLIAMTIHAWLPFRKGDTKVIVGAGAVGSPKHNHTTSSGRNQSEHERV